ncbi:MAG: PadR family transcriptional regulator [Candidatus Tenebribacter davisii]|nr:PadR family transcriptional regulator [Candidatus Tenebribacter davisii]
MSRLDLVVLGFLNRQPMHGYEIIGYFEKRGIEMWTQVKTPSVYKALQRLEKKGYITGEMKQKGNNPPRKVFTITITGKKYFMETLRSFLWGKGQFQTPFDFWNAFRFIQKNITHSEFIRVLENRELKHEKMERIMKDKHKQAVECGDMPDFPFYAKIMHESMIKMKTIEIEIIKEMKSAAKLPENQKDFKKEKE